MNHYIDQGYQIALDDVGAWDYGLNRVVDTTPNYLKVDIDLYVIFILVNLNKI